MGLGVIVGGLWSEESKDEEEKSEQGSGRHYIRRMWPRVG